MRGLCLSCQEYRSDDSLDAWKIRWKSGYPTCEKCGSFVDVWKNNDKKKGSSKGRPSIPSISLGRKHGDRRQLRGI